MDNRWWKTYGVVAAGVALIPWGQVLQAQHMQVVQVAVGQAHTGSRISMDVTNSSLAEAIHSVAREAKLTPIYDASTFPYSKIVTVSVRNEDVETAFRKVLAGTGLVAKVSGGGDVLIVRDVWVVAQGIVTGKVIHAKTKQPVNGAAILIDGAATGATTGPDGTFRVSAEDGEHVIHVRAMGYVRNTRKVTVVKGETVHLDVVLEPSASVLDEVVVTGTVVATERKAIPTPITVITAEELERRGITKIDQLFRGEVPGVVAVDFGSATYADQLGAMVKSSVYSRGASTIYNGETPLKTYIDGVELLDPSYLGLIDPVSIERIEIVTGPQAATIYGSGAMGGVMQIFTKKGNAGRGSEATLRLRYGILQSNFSDGRTPAHNHALDVRGGQSAEFSYSANVSYNYTGQWMPFLYLRTVGGSIGGTYTTGPLITTGSLSFSSGDNGTNTSSRGVGYAGYGSSLIEQTERQSGEWELDSRAGGNGQQVSKSLGFNMALNLDYRVRANWQHHVTLGQSRSDFSLVPTAPRFFRASDTLFSTSGSTGRRLTYGYNTTWQGKVRALSSTVTLGGTGSQGQQTQWSGTASSKLITSFASSSISQAFPSSSQGLFGSLQLGVFEQLFVTLGLRGEFNRAYGRNHPIDWTPTNGVTYTFTVQELTIKLLGSYGRATRTPNETQRNQVITINSQYDPPQYISRFENPELRPEYSKGPQGGIELYYGNLGSLTLTHFSQKITDLIEAVKVDSLELFYIPTGEMRYLIQYRYENTAKIRQYGWEGTSALNLGPVNIKGTYSWNDSRLLELAPASNTPRSAYYEGMSFYNVPSHMGSISASFAHQATTLSVTTNWVGAAVGGSGSWEYYQNQYSRLKTYLPRMIEPFGYYAPGSSKTDLNFSQRIHPSLIGTLLIRNITNESGSGIGVLFPTLGRQTQMGISLKF